MCLQALPKGQHHIPFDFGFRSFIIISMFGKLLDTATYLKAKIKRDQLEIALTQATNDDNWQASTNILHEIASSAYNHQKWQKIRDFLWQKLKNNKKWKKILKALNIVQFILKNGPGYAVDHFKYEHLFFKSLTSFQQYEGGVDRGAAIRERAKAIIPLLQNDQMLQDERLRAKQIREKMSHMSGSVNYSSGGESRPASSPQAGRYESYNSKSVQNAKQNNNGYYNYGSGNYGDRQEDVKYNHDYFQNINRFKKTQSDKTKTNNTQPKAYQGSSSPIYIPPKVAPKVDTTAKNQATGKSKFESITQKLMKAGTKIQDGIIKPDLSYKKIDNANQLIDAEEYFVESRYHFEEPKQNIPEQIAQIPNKNTAYTPPTIAPPPKIIEQPKQQPKVQQETKTIAPPLIPIDFNFITQAVPTATKVNPDYNSGNLTQLSQVSLLQTSVLPPPPVTVQAPVPVPVPVQAPVPVPVPNPTNYPSIYNQPNPLQPIYPNHFPMGASYGQQNLYQNPYNQQYQNNYGGYTGYQQYAPPSYPNPYVTPYSSGYPNPYQNPYYTAPNPQPINPYQNTSAITMNLSPSPVVTPSKPQAISLNSNSNNNKSGTNGLSAQDFNNQKVNWLTKNQKNLTDLSDLATDIGQIKKKQQKPKEHNNNIKIDLWAW